MLSISIMPLTCDAGLLVVHVFHNISTCKDYKFQFDQYNVFVVSSVYRLNLSVLK